jgi:LysM repeat protein
VAVEFGRASLIAPPVPAAVAGGVTPLLPPLPSVGQGDSYASYAPYASSTPSGQLGNDLVQLGADGATVVGQVGQSVLTGGQQLAGVAVRNAPAVGNAVWTGAQQVSNGVAVAAPVVTKGLFGGLSWLTNGLAKMFGGLFHLFGHRQAGWDGPVVVVQPGDTLATIARRTMGDATRWPEIYAWNRDLLAQPSDLHVGMMLRLPPYLDGQAVVTPSPTAVPVPTGQAGRTSGYTVKSGDSLWALAQTYYGDGNRWQEIYAANRSQIANPRLIYPGQVLVIPRR